jgi:hypothetical protein
MSSAGEVTPTPEFDDLKSTRTRAEVQAELDKARAAGEQPGAGEVTPCPEIEKAKSLKTREQVKAELEAYIKSGQRDRDQGETQIGG